MPSVPNTGVPACAKLPDQKAWQQIFFRDPEYRETIAREVDEWLASGTESTIFQRRYTDKWGRDHDVIVHVFRLKNRFYNFLEDISEFKRFEENLLKGYNVLEKRISERTNDLLRTNLQLKKEIEDRKRAEERLKFTQFAVDHSSDAAFWLKPDARFVYVNEAACNSLGYAKEELLNLTVHDIDPNFPREVWHDHWEKVKRQSTQILESCHRTKDGNIFPVEISANYI